MTAAEATECVAILEARTSKQLAADSIVQALERHLAGRRLAEQVQAEREAREREHAYWARRNASAGCPDCLSLGGEGVCIEHDVNKEYL